MSALLASQSLAAPTICARCDSLVREDTEFTANLALYGMPQRRYVCVMGHSTYTGLDTIPALKVSNGSPVQLPRTIPRQERTCARCGDLFSGIKRQKFCSIVCTRAADYERNRGYLSKTKTGKRLTPEELRVARAMPSPFGARGRAKVLVPYATRPTNLSQTWV